MARPTRRMRQRATWPACAGAHCQPRFAATICQLRQPPSSLPAPALPRRKRDKGQKSDCLGSKADAINLPARVSPAWAERHSARTGRHSISNLDRCCRRATNRRCAPGRRLAQNIAAEMSAWPDVAAHSATIASSRQMPQEISAPSSLRSGSVIGSKVSPSPRIPRHALAGVGAGDLRELAFEGCGRRPAVQPFHFGRCGGER